MVVDLVVLDLVEEEEVLLLLFYLPLAAILQMD
jgi:hypothetical protein